MGRNNAGLEMLDADELPNEGGQPAVGKEMVAAPDCPQDQAGRPEGEDLGSSRPPPSLCEAPDPLACRIGRVSDRVDRAGRSSNEQIRPYSRVAQRLDHAHLHCGVTGSASQHERHRAPILGARAGRPQRDQPRVKRVLMHYLLPFVEWSSTTTADAPAAYSSNVIACRHVSVVRHDRLVVPEDLVSGEGEIER